VNAKSRVAIDLPQNQYFSTIAADVFELQDEQHNPADERSLSDRRVRRKDDSPTPGRRRRHKFRRAVRKGRRDSVHSAQVSELEIPVTIQGSKPVEGTDRRELFTEATKTTIVSENGAVLCLKSSVLPGQCVFLRNEHSGREILCKVLESRQGGVAHYTDLEFVDCDPKFWDVSAEQPVAARQTPEIHKIKPGGTSPVATLGMEPSSRPGGHVALSFLETNTMAPVCPESTKPEWNDAKDQELMAALIAIDAKQLAKRESDKKSATESEPKAAFEDASEQSETISDTASDAEVFSTPASRICRTRKFTAYRNPIAVGVAAFVSIAAVLSIAWHIRHSSIHSNRPSASTTQSRQHAVPVPSPGQSSPTGGSAVAIGTPIAADAPQRSNVVSHSAVSATPKVKTSNGTLSSPKGALAQAKSGKLNELSTEEIIPAKILSQSLPSIPPWAKGLDMDGIVQLDALIDENGNVAEVKPMSGPRLLQRAAERAVALWIFQPALSDGKPTATHIVLTVQFQR